MGTMMAPSAKPETHILFGTDKHKHRTDVTALSTSSTGKQIGTKDK